MYGENLVWMQKTANEAFLQVQTESEAPILTSLNFGVVIVSFPSAQ